MGEIAALRSNDTRKSAWAKRTNTDEHGRWRNLSIKNIAGNRPLPDGRGLVVCWAARRHVIHFNIRKRLRGFIALVSIPEYIRRWFLRLGLPAKPP